MAEEMMNQQMGGGVMTPPPENVSDMGGNQPMQPMQQSPQEDLLAKGREILMQRVEQLAPEEKSILANAITPEFTQVVTKVFGPAVNDFLEILTVEMPNQESAPAPEPMVAQGEGMMMNRPPVQETAPAQV
jgi:hypothetical protein